MENSNVVKIGQPITKVGLVNNTPVVDVEEVILETVKLPDDSPARMKVLHSEGRKWYLTVVHHEGSEQPFALFCHTNSHEKTAQTSNAVDVMLTLARNKGIPSEFVDGTIKKMSHDSNVTKLTRVISLLLRHGVLIKNIVGELDKMEDVFVGSFLFQLKKFLSNYIRDGEKAEGRCGDCGGQLVFSEGCYKCLDCGGSKCG